MHSTADDAPSSEPVVDLVDPAAPLLIVGGRLLDAHGTIVPNPGVRVIDGRIAAFGATVDAPPAGRVVRLVDEVLAPGLVDAHCHIAWAAFHDSERADIDSVRTEALVSDALTRTLRSGVTLLRDAGGADETLRRRAASDPASAPRLSLSHRIITATDAPTADAMRRVVAALADDGADWVKLAATGGLGDADALELVPRFSRETVRAATEEAAAHGLRVMVHAWGGAAIDDALDAGVASIEHAIFLTPAQAHTAAASGVTIVPTLRIYQLLTDAASPVDLPAPLRARAEAVVEAHPRAVGDALDARATVAVGTDFGTPQQHGRIAEELAALRAVGLSAAEVLVAATRAGATLVEGDPSAGVLSVGGVFDAVALRGLDAPGAPTVTRVFRSGIGT
ncbi:MAG: amidohydrolase family protein [Microbacterium ginsengisoli]|uniref:amidohydrolase family protein n=1 Tax=Microbacterium TaxID=33882 RepID=UPI0006F7D329|nr:MULTISPECIES: amidohydrolase family protein [unclassified Microbacterium]MBN9197071.1 amidohydrolase family protein [Microbacterium ginsengisoli]KQR91257.1 hypothetical protein ASF93_07885 [Microbacterium sp. Leaf347]KQS01249.1 hypothetical protein ASG00_10710 [Microbacterium sp. Leaf351]ODU79170.1 MAG: hypothetical protein ABT08_02055 [Microbacterium sp. SCN 71-21]OJU77028.1 MAG: hypothetical protein BGO15_05860 [Microbacterium sp. 71-23]